MCPLPPILIGRSASEEQDVWCVDVNCVLWSMVLVVTASILTIYWAKERSNVLQVVLGGQ